MEVLLCVVRVCVCVVCVREKREGGIIHIYDTETVINFFVVIFCTYDVIRATYAWSSVNEAEM